MNHFFLNYIYYLYYFFCIIGFLSWVASVTAALILLCIRRYLLGGRRHCICNKRNNNNVQDEIATQGERIPMFPHTPPSEATTPSSECDNTFQPGSTNTSPVGLLRRKRKKKGNVVCVTESRSTSRFAARIVDPWECVVSASSGFTNPSTPVPCADSGENSEPVHPAVPGRLIPSSQEKNQRPF